MKIIAKRKAANVRAPRALATLLMLLLSLVYVSLRTTETALSFSLHTIEHPHRVDADSVVARAAARAGSVPDEMLIDALFGKDTWKQAQGVWYGKPLSFCKLDNVRNYALAFYIDQPSFALQQPQRSPLSAAAAAAGSSSTAASSSSPPLASRSAPTSVSDNNAIDIDLSQLNYVALTAHLGPLVDLALFANHTLRVPAERLHCVCWMNFCQLYPQLMSSMATGWPVGVNENMAALLRMHWSHVWSGYRIGKKMNVFYEPEPIHHLRVRERNYWRDRWKAMSWADVVFCEFPSSFCVDLMDVADEARVTLVVRFSHRYWHHLNQKHWNAWGAAIRALAQSERHIVAANNPFDALVVSYYLGVEVLPWPAAGEVALYDPETTLETRRWRPAYCNRTGVALIGESGQQYTREIVRLSALLHGAVAARWAMTATEIAAASLKQPQWRFRTPEDPCEPHCMYNDKKYSQTLVIVWPYATHTTATIELYRRGVPLLMPSARLSAEAEQSSVLKMTHAYTGFGDEQSFAHMVTNNTCQHARLGPPLAYINDVDSTAAWLRGCDYHIWPGVFTYDSFDMNDLVDRISEIVSDYTGLERASQRAIAFSHYIHRHRARVVTAALQRARYASMHRIGPPLSELFDRFDSPVLRNVSNIESLRKPTPCGISDCSMQSSTSHVCKSLFCADCERAEPPTLHVGSLLADLRNHESRSSSESHAAHSLASSGGNREHDWPRRKSPVSAFASSPAAATSAAASARARSHAADRSEFTDIGTSHTPKISSKRTTIRYGFTSNAHREHSSSSSRTRYGGGGGGGGGGDDGGGAALQRRRHKRSGDGGARASTAASLDAERQKIVYNVIRSPKWDDYDDDDDNYDDDHDDDDDDDDEDNHGARRSGAPRGRYNAAAAFAAPPSPCVRFEAGDGSDGGNDCGDDGSSARRGLSFGENGPRNAQWRERTGAAHAHADNAAAAAAATESDHGDGGAYAARVRRELAELNDESPLMGGAALQRYANAHGLDMNASLAARAGDGTYGEHGDGVADFDDNDDDEDVAFLLQDDSGVGVARVVEQTTVTNDGHNQGQYESNDDDDDDDDHDSDNDSDIHGDVDDARYAPYEEADSAEASMRALQLSLGTPAMTDEAAQKFAKFFDESQGAAVGATRGTFLNANLHSRRIEEDDDEDGGHDNDDNGYVNGGNVDNDSNTAHDNLRIGGGGGRFAAAQVRSTVDEHAAAHDELEAIKATLHAERSYAEQSRIDARNRAPYAQVESETREWQTAVSLELERAHGANMRALARDDARLREERRAARAKRAAAELAALHSRAQQALHAHESERERVARIEREAAAERKAAEARAAAEAAEAERVARERRAADEEKAKADAQAKAKAAGEQQQAAAAAAAAATAAGTGGALSTATAVQAGGEPAQVTIAGVGGVKADGSGVGKRVESGKGGVFVIEEALVPANYVQALEDAQVPKANVSVMQRVACTRSAFADLEARLTLLASLRAKMSGIESIALPPQVAPWAQVSRAYKKAVNKTVQQISSKLQQVENCASILGNACQQAIATHPAHGIFIIENISLKMIENADLMRGSVASLFPLAAVAVRISAAFEQFTSVFLAVFEEICPYITPRYACSPKENNEDAHKAHLIASGYRYIKSKGTMEGQDRYVQRMCAYVSFYGAITQFIDVPNHPHGIDYAWRWLARVANTRSRPITTSIVWAFLRVAGWRMSLTFGKQFRKLVVALQALLLSGESECVNAADRAQLEDWISDYLKTGKVDAPEGVQFE